MTRERIIAALPDGRVDIVIPDEEGIRCLMLGTAYARHPWRGRDPLYWIIQLQRKLSPISLSPGGTATRKPEAVISFCKAMQFGGLSREEAVKLIGEYTAGHYAASLTVVDVAELPFDRKYRSAWRYTHNRGFHIDEEAVEEIQINEAWHERERSGASLN